MAKVFLCKSWLADIRLISGSISQKSLGNHSANGFENSRIFLSTQVSRTDW